jgi:ferredoxin/flavodoxin---NADP+ reductase
LYTILRKSQIGPETFRMDILAPRAAKRAAPGQFIMLRVTPDGERIPLTVADFDHDAGVVTIIFQVVGYTTKLLAAMEPGQALADFLGPLGKPAELPEKGHVLCVGGGVGVAVVYPEVKELFRRGVDVDVIIGARSENLIILEDECRAVCKRLFVTTDDGSKGRKGLVTDVLKEQLTNEHYDEVIAIGPVIMMKFVCKMTKEFGVKTTASMNPIMVDGTGMCGCCRVTVGGEVKYACVDGPEFDGHQIDFDEAMKRLTAYREEEKAAVQRVPCGEGDCKCR